MSYTLVLEWMPGDLYMSAVTARCTAPTSSYSVVWLPPNKVYQITLYCGSTSLVSFLVGAFRGKAWSYMKSNRYLTIGLLTGFIVGGCIGVLAWAFLQNLFAIPICASIGMLIGIVIGTVIDYEKTSKEIDKIDDSLKGKS